MFFRDLDAIKVKDGAYGFSLDSTVNRDGFVNIVHEHIVIQ